MEQNPHVGIAKGRYGFTKESSLVAFLENLDFLTAFDEVKDFLLASLGASGSIYRVNIIKQIGGFDENIKGSCEDIDAVYRLADAGWVIVRDLAPFYSRGKGGWKKYWAHLVWHGYGAHYIKHKNKHIFSLSKKLPLWCL